jgi:cytochrome oxidase Cu insertion factor (SCO1/SenC/PrrC family)
MSAAAGGGSRHALAVAGRGRRAALTGLLGLGLPGAGLVGGAGAARGAAAGAAPGAGSGAGPGAGGGGPGGAAPGVAGRLRGPVPDLRVTDARGRRRRLASEVIGGRVVAVDFVLTGCSSLCGVVSAAMAGAQALLGARLPGAAGLLSIGLDPFADTPEALAEYGRRFGAGPGWELVQVPAAGLEEVLRRLGGPSPGADHAPVVLALDPLRGAVRRLPGLPAPEAIAGAVAALLAARGGEGEGGGGEGEGGGAGGGGAGGGGGRWW